jgi:hypothetical protein
MGQKKKSQRGFFLIASVLLVLLVCSLAYLKFSSKDSPNPHNTVQLDLSKKEITKTTDLIYLKANAKNGTPIEIKHMLKNTGRKDITRITLDGLLLQKRGQNESQSIYIQAIKFGNQLYTPKYFKFLGFDLNKDGKISLEEFAKNHFPLGSLVKDREREFVLQGKYEKGLPPFNSDNEEARIFLDLSYKLE